ncbi:DUF397 domain-containing protein [Saccharothrix longispora]|uniref:DUF397 domain-containing protein n=1 Tax=Saccharothrix longispora TaxID=33920 RepID=A0ABU1PX73_9PSEU|nr:DUF397 domain-containing protein [Saccharothrix longispora]MDR6595248.1 hypothetical protein [Saccharothrix longispora]
MNTGSWRKSSHSTATGNCVEVARTTGGVLLRDSKQPAAGVVTVPDRSWAAFRAAVAPRV